MNTPHSITPPLQIGEQVICVRGYHLGTLENQLEAGESAVITGIELWRDGGLVEDWTSVQDGFWHFTAKSEDGLLDKWAMRATGETSLPAAFKRPSELSPEDHAVIDQTKNYQPIFRIYREFTTGLHRIFWKSRHPHDEAWGELGCNGNPLGTEPLRYSSLGLAKDCVEKVKMLPRKHLIQFSPDSLTDPVFGNLVDEIESSPHGTSHL